MKVMILKGIEIFRAGYANDGRKILSSEIPEIYENTLKAIKDGFFPKVKNGQHHHNAQPCGIIQNVILKGNRILADVEIAEEIYEAMESRKISTDRSVEVVNNLVLSTGEKLGKTLKAVVFGLDMPAIHNLAPVFENLKSWGEGSVYLYEYESSNIEKETSMKIEVEKSVYDEMVAENAELRKKLKELEAKFESVGKDNIKKEEFESEIEKAKKLEESNKELKAEIEKYERQTREVFVDKLISDELILPVQKDSVMSYYEHCISQNEGDIEKAQKEVSEMFSSRVDVHTASGIETHTVSDERVGTLDPTAHGEV